MPLLTFKLLISIWRGDERQTVNRLPYFSSNHLYAFFNLFLRNDNKLILKEAKFALCLKRNNFRQCRYFKIIAINDHELTTPFFATASSLYIHTVK
jgi:hypothetical protein